MTDRDDDSLMLAYVYGELSESEGRAFEARLAKDAGLRAEVDGLLATRAFLGEDARYGASSGLDLPPPHLTDAILRAELLARPSEIRQAHAASGQSWLSRLSTWLVGGGLAVTAAAAFLLVAKDGASPEADVAMAPSPVAQVAPAADEPMAGAEKADSKPAEQPASIAAEPAEEARERNVPADNFALDEVAGDRAAATVKVPKGGAFGAGDVDTFANEGSVRREQDAKDEPQKGGGESKRDALGGLASRDDALGADGDDDGLVGGGGGRGFATGTGASAPTKTRAKAELAAPAEPEPEPETAPSSTSDTLRFNDVPREDKSDMRAAPRSAQRKVAAAPQAKPRPGASMPAGPPPLPPVVKELAKKSKESARSSRRAQVDDQTPGRAAKQRIQQELETTLLTAERELSQGRPLEALDLFTSAARRDPRGALVGVVPYVGQMRAMYALGRHREVIALVPTVRRPGIHAPAVADGLLTGARSAEAVGDVRLARQLYRELLVVKDKQKLAEEGLARVGEDKRYRQREAESYDAEADSAASEPAAAAEE